MRERQRLIPKKDRVLGHTHTHTQGSEQQIQEKARLAHTCEVVLPVVELEARPPVGGAKQRLNSTGQVHEEVAHEEEPEQWQRRNSQRLVLQASCPSENPPTWTGWEPQRPRRR